MHIHWLEKKKTFISLTFKPPRFYFLLKSGFFGCCVFFADHCLSGASSWMIDRIAMGDFTPSDWGGWRQDPRPWSALCLLCPVLCGALCSGAFLSRPTMTCFAVFVQHWLFHWIGPHQLAFGSRALVAHDPVTSLPSLTLYRWSWCGIYRSSSKN